MENQTTETLAPAVQKKSFLQRTPKWALLSAPVLAIALLGYGYSTGHLQQVARQASVAIATFVPAVAKAAGVEDQLSVARAAFAKGDMNVAIAAYRTHIAANPTDLSAHGELGNVLYTVGALPEAAQAYFDVASLALEQNHPEVAEALLPAVSEGNPMLADQLSEKLFNAQMRTDLARPVEGAPQQPSQQQG